MEVLLVEDNPGDIRLIEEAIKELGDVISLRIVTDGVQALDYLFKKNAYIMAPTPDLILLDLNVPKEDGRKVLSVVKNDSHLKRIPVIVLTISQNEEDVLECYNLHANCYITKPFEIDSFIQIIKAIKSFWLDVVTLPPKKELESD
jgi:chemotaxis family two-component system response regulator Rcp1